MLWLCQRLNTEEPKNKVVHTTQDINVSIKSTLFENIPVPLLHTLAGAIDGQRSCLISAATGFII